MSALHAFYLSVQSGGSSALAEPEGGGSSTSGGESDGDGGVVQWRSAALGLSSDLRYWWRSAGDEDAAPEVALEQPKDAWRLSMLPNGKPYLWRESDDPDDPDIRLWRRSTLQSGDPFWYTEEGAVALSDPHDLERGYTEF